ncbi:Stage V sporulation protein T [compost metagenome]
MESGGGAYEIVKDSKEAYTSYVVAPIVAGGDPIGSVIMLSREEGVKMGEMELKMVEIAAGFLGKQMEQ